MYVMCTGLSSCLSKIPLAYLSAFLANSSQASTFICTERHRDCVQGIQMWWHFPNTLAKLFSKTYFKVFYNLVSPKPLPVLN